MQNRVKELAGQLMDKDCQVLIWEVLLFSGVFAAAYRSWTLFGVMLPGLFWMLTLPKGKIYVSVALSCLWGIIVASLGYSFGGWPWATVCGVGMLLVGIGTHMRNLILSVDCKMIPRRFIDTQAINHRWGRHTLN